MPFATSILFEMFYNKCGIAHWQVSIITCRGNVLPIAKINNYKCPLFGLHE
jgi:hypothetical protein